MKKYELLTPWGEDIDISDYVQRGPAEYSEIAFELDTVNTPTVGQLVCDNARGFFTEGLGIFKGEVTEYIVRISDGDLTLFVGLVDDVEYFRAQATIRMVSVVAKLIQQAVPVNNPIAYIGPPAGLVLYVLQNEVILPGLFVDAVELTNVAQAETARGIEIEVNITLEDAVQYSTLMQTLYKMTGLYVHSSNGLIKATRQGQPGAEFSSEWDERNYVSGTPKLSRPTRWQKTAVEVAGPVSQIRKNMSDFFPTGATIISRFSDKLLRTDGLGGKMKHTTSLSADECSADLLGWRGFLRHKLSFEVDTVDAGNSQRLQQISLFEASRVITDQYVFIGLLVKKKIKENKAFLEFYSSIDPFYTDPNYFNFPTVANAQSVVSVSGNGLYEIGIKLKGESDYEIHLTDRGNFSIFKDNPEQLIAYIYAKTRDSRMKRIIHIAMHINDLTVFLVGHNKVGQLI